MLSKRRLQVADHFESLVNELDIKTERALAESQSDRVKCAKLNEKRDIFLAELKQLETLNLRHVETLDFQNDTDKNPLIFKHFCFFVDQNDMDMPHLSEIDALFGYLILLEYEFIPMEKLARFRKYLRFYNRNVINSTEYFNMRLNPADFHQSIMQIKSELWTRHTDPRFVINTTISDLYTIDEFNITNQSIHSIIRPTDINTLYENKTIKQLTFSYSNNHAVFQFAEIAKTIEILTGGNYAKNVLRVELEVLGQNRQTLDMSALAAVTRLDRLRFENCSSVMVVESGSFRTLTRLSELVLSNNAITTLTGGAFVGLANLRTLLIENNQIRILDASMFEGLDSLEHLSLYNNNVNSIDSATFSPLKSLKKLTLIYNKIRVLDRTKFTGLKRLQELSLRYNQIKRVEEFAFESLAELVKLDLYGNKINELEANAFVGLSKLEVLVLSENRLAVLNRSSFNGLTALRELNLGNNELNMVDVGTFDCLASLEELNLSFNELEELDAGLFAGLDGSLRRLFLNNNELVRVEKGVFEGLRRLQELWLNSNRLARLERGVFKGCGELRKVKLGKNKFKDGVDEGAIFGDGATSVVVVVEI